MKKILNLLSVTTVLAVSLMLFSCSEEFLTKEPPAVAGGSVVESPEGIENLLIGVYERMQGNSMFGGALVSDWTYSGGCSDDAYKGTSSGDQSNFNLLERYEALPNNPYLLDRWNNAYDGVARANVVLTFLEKVQAGPKPMLEARAKQVEGEAKFMRAWYHFQLNKIFEKIPYIKTVSELGSTSPEAVPNTDAGWAGIEEDLQVAIVNLPETPIMNQPGRPTMYAAMAFKAQAHMYQKEYAAAKDLLDKIIASKKFELVADYTWNFDMTHENNKESIFEMQCGTTANATTAVDGSGCNFHQKGAASCGGWGFYQVSSDLFNAFQVDANGLPKLNRADRVNLATDMGIGSAADFTPTAELLDPRVDYLVARRGVDFLGWGIHPGNDWIREQNNGGPMMTKIFMHKKDEQTLNLNGNGFRNGKNYRMMRYASVLLWRAECAIEDNDLEMARTLVNEVRTRAKNSPPVMGLVSSTADLLSDPVVDWTKPAANYKVEPYAAGYPFDTKENALKAVQEETRLEFALQNHRFFDLRRWGIIEKTLDDYIAHDITFRTFMQGANFEAGKDEYWPLPQPVLDLQPGIISQDPDYK